MTMAQGKSRCSLDPWHRESSSLMFLFSTGDCGCQVCLPDWRKKALLSVRITWADPKTPPKPKMTGIEIFRQPRLDSLTSMSAIGALLKNSSPQRLAEKICTTTITSVGIFYAFRRTVRKRTTGKHGEVSVSQTQRADWLPVRFRTSQCSCGHLSIL